MRVLFMAVSAASALLVAACATAPESAEGTKVASAGAAGDPNRMVCRKERAVGSNRPEKICMTAAEWQGLTQRSRDEMERVQSAPGTTPVGGGPGGGG